MSDRDLIILEKILMCCGMVNGFKKQYGGVKAMSDNLSYQYCCSMCLLQIEEMSDKLSDETKLRMRMMPWDTIKRFKEIIEPEYFTVNWKLIWEIISEDIPILEYTCEKYLETL